MSGWTDTEIVISGIAGLLAAIEVRGLIRKQKGDTISEWTRMVFRTNTKTGKAAWVAVWGGFSIWYFGHILNLWP